MANTNVSSPGEAAGTGANTGENTSTSTSAAQNTSTNTGATGSDGKKVFSEDFVQDLYKENGKHRLKNKELTEKLKSFEDAQAAAEQKRLEEAGEHKKLADEAEKRAKKAEKDARETVERQQRKTIKTAVRAELIREGIIDPDDVALLDLEKITWDADADEPDGVTALVTEFKKAKPAKFKVTEADNGQNVNGRMQTQRATTATPGSNGTTNTRSIDYRDPAVTKEELDRAWDAKFSRA